MQGSAQLAAAFFTTGISLPLLSSTFFYLRGRLGEVIRRPTMSVLLWKYYHVSTVKI